MGAALGSSITRDLVAVTSSLWHPLHERPVSDAWMDKQVHWHGYSMLPGGSITEIRNRSVADRPMDAVLLAPVQVAHWIELQYAVHYPASQPRTRLHPKARFELAVRQRYRHETNEAIAASGQSLYVQICDLDAPGRPITREVWLEAVGEEVCQAQAHGERPGWDG
jgi:hypothetical protein